MTALPRRSSATKDTARQSRNQTCRAVSKERCHLGDTNVLADLCQENTLQRVSVTTVTKGFRSGIGRPLRIAQVAPVATSIPPARSGSIETMTSLLTEGLVA